MHGSDAEPQDVSLPPEIGIPTQSLSEPLISTSQISTLLHEVRNPLMTVQTLAKLLQKRLSPEDANRWISTSIEQECHHLQALLSQFEQDLHDLKAQHQQAPEWIEIKDWLESLQPSYEAIAIAHGLSLSLSWDTHVSYPALYLDPLALKQVVSNLIDNACKYTTQGHIHLELGVELDHSSNSSNQIYIAISDTGSGIPSDQLAHIFDPYVRANQSQPGQGLGLAISRQLIQQMGGSIEVNSQLGHGSTFTIRLPVTNKTSHDKQHDQQGDQA